MKLKSLTWIAVVLGIAVAAYSRHLISGDAIILLGALVPSVILHEVSHGYAALLFGDDTAKRAGRLTLNPLAHIDPVGSVILPALLILAGVTPIGYAKPVPVDLGKLRSPRNQSVFVSLAGPIVNIAIALFVGFLFRLDVGNSTYVSSALTARYSLSGKILFYLGAVNVLLAVFNLIPIPPLDGSAVVERILPTRYLGPYIRLRRVMLPVALVVFLLFPSAIQNLISPVINLWVNTFVR